jgi:nicotinamide mononucleotide transporter
MRFQRSTIALAALTGLAATLAAIMVGAGKATWLEAASFVTGALCVWLTVKENVWNFPIGLVNVATFSVVFFNCRLYADAGLQIVYFLLGLMGWYLWLHGGERRTALRIAKAGNVERVVVIAAAVTMTFLLWTVLQRVGGSATFWDATTTSISLASQWLLNRKRLESWIGWIVVDVIYVPLYIYKDLYLTAMLYAIFLVMAVMGLRVWRSVWRRQVELARRMTAEPPQEVAV